jgi:hypothetical protein
MVVSQTTLPHRQHTHVFVHVFKNWFGCRGEFSLVGRGYQPYI